MSVIQARFGQPGVYNTTLPTLSDGLAGALQLDANGRLILSPGGASGYAIDDSAMPATPSIFPVGGEYRASSTTYTDGDATVLQQDVNGNLKTTLATALNRLDDAISSFEKMWTPVNLTASGQILSAPGQIKGFYVNSTSSGTVRIADNTAAGSGYLQATATPAIGWHEFPSILSVGGYVTIANTIDVTFFVRED